MSIAVLAQHEKQKELEARLQGFPATLYFADSLKDLLSYTADIYFDLEFKMEKKRIDALSEFLPKPVFIDSVAYTLKDIGKDFVRINGWNTFFENRISEIVIPNPEIQKSALAFLESANWSYQIVPDVPGMISARIISMIINEAYFTAQAGVGTKEDIDIAMTLGTNYPYGPFAWGEKIGLKKIYELLVALNKQDGAYMISDMLQAEALKNE
ncbi:MAG TPA: 3-hydroxyacyl-CoA dehydrogenase family protein [Puia sp.]|nr:3-hydroxyacyl-CoA dehydrogenase family protein [Puia sp.]